MVVAEFQCSRDTFTVTTENRCFYIASYEILLGSSGVLQSNLIELQFPLPVLRDGRWSEQDASILVPGDIISIKLGDIVPADACLLEGDPLKIDQSALTEESLPVTKNPLDEVFSGSTCKQDEIEVVVLATGVHTFFGKAAHLVDNTNNVGHFQKVLTPNNNWKFLHCAFLSDRIKQIMLCNDQVTKRTAGYDDHSPRCDTIQETL